MNRCCWLAVVTTLICSLPCRGQTPAAAADAAVREAAAQLREARQLLKGVTNLQTRDRLELLLSRAELRLGEAQKQLALVATTPAAQPVTKEDLDGLLKGIRKEAFDSGKVPFVANVARTRHFTSVQVRELLKTFSFDDGRSQAALILYPRVVDPGNFYLALEAFTFDSNRKALRAKLQSR